MRPYRERKPRHPGFYKKPKPEKKALLRKGAAAAAADPYKDGKLRLFLDDDRTCPPGWTLVKSVGALKDALEQCNPAELAEVSLDWYLGVGLVDGHGAVELLIETLKARREEFTSLTDVYCHSADMTEAGGMARTLGRAVLLSKELPYFHVHVGMPTNWRN